MSEPLLRDGKLVGNPLAGIDIDDMSFDQKQQVQALLRKNDSGEKITLKDLAVLRELRRGPADPLNKVKQCIDELNGLLDG